MSDKSILNNYNEKYLVLFSGGKDSFLTACRLINNGNKVILLSFNGGGVIGEENFLHGVNRLIKRYGKGRVEFAGIYPTVGTIARLNRTWVYDTQQELGNKYPNITNCQFQCLHCQTAMWVAAIAYAMAKDIKFIASGYKKTDVFCTGMDRYLKRITTIANEHNISIEFPLWELANDYERDIEMSRYSFWPQVYEPKCVLGNPVKNGLPIKEQDDMMRYFDDELIDIFIQSIDSLVNIFRYIKLDNKSFHIIHYEDTSGEGGMY